MPGQIVSQTGGCSSKFTWFVIAYTPRAWTYCQPVSGAHGLAVLHVHVVRVHASEWPQFLRRHLDLQQVGTWLAG